jgi:hypothetical protein
MSRERSFYFVYSVQDPRPLRAYRQTTTFRDSSAKSLYFCIYPFPLPRLSFLVFCALTCLGIFFSRWLALPSAVGSAALTSRRIYIPVFSGLFLWVFCFSPLCIFVDLLIPVYWSPFGILIVHSLLLSTISLIQATRRSCRTVHRCYIWFPCLLSRQKERLPMGHTIWIGIVLPCFRRTPEA